MERGDVLSSGDIEAIAEVVADRVTAAVLNSLKESGSQVLNRGQETMTLRDIQTMTGIAKSSWWAGVKSGAFPKPLEGFGHPKRWSASDIRRLCGIGKGGAQVD